MSMLMAYDCCGLQSERRWIRELQIFQTHFTRSTLLQGTGAPHPSTAVPSPGASQDRSWIGILLAILAVLVIIIIALVLLFYWRYVTLYHVILIVRHVISIMSFHGNRDTILIAVNCQMSKCMKANKSELSFKIPIQITVHGFYELLLSCFPFFFLILLFLRLQEKKKKRKSREHTPTKIKRFDKQCLT